MKIETANTALLLMNMQNDFVHSEGALSRNGLFLTNGLVLRERLIKLLNKTREAGVPIIASNFTLVSDNQHRPLIGEEIAERYPFLSRGDFQWGKWGHQLMEEFKPADYMVPKISQSAFFMTHLEWLIQQVDIKTLVFCGISSSRDIRTSIADAKKLGIRCILVEDCSGDIDADQHADAIQHLSNEAQVISYGDLEYQ